jgi:hypothetical protein
MAVRVRARDESTTGASSNELCLELQSERTTARELIRARVYQEVTEHNAFSALLRGPLEPKHVGRGSNGARAAPGRVDWEHQYARALTAFERNGFMLLVDDRQLERLDDEVDVRADATITFLRLVPLVGG